MYDFPDKLLSNKEIKKRHKEIHKAHLSQTFQGLRMIEEMPKPSLIDIGDKMLVLPLNSQIESRKTVVFDLDETLVHCVEGELGDAEVIVRFPTGESIKVSLM